MIKHIFKVLFFILFVLNNVVSNGQDVIKHAIIKSTIETILPDNSSPTVISMLTYYKDGKWKIITKKEGSNDMTYIIGYRTTILTNVMGKKIGFFIDDSSSLQRKENIVNPTKNMDSAQKSYTVSYIDTTKMINGYNCNEAIIKYNEVGAKISKVTVWYCKDLNFGDTKASGMNIGGLELLKGYPIDIKVLTTDNTTVHIYITNIETEKDVNNEEFLIPSDFLITNYKEFINKVNKLTQ